jgi:L-ascorbate metabolism protein UlaG (beta-lactamase superfamily)
MDMPARKGPRAVIRRPAGLRDLLRSLAGGPGWNGPVSDHFDGQLFFNRDASAGRSFRDLLRWRRTAQKKVWPTWVENRARPSLPPRLAAGEVALTFVNHITFLIQFPQLNLLTDPVYSERVSPFRNIGPKRVRAPGLPFDQLPRIDVVLVTHNHYDHLDIDTLVRLEAEHQPHFITGLGNRAFLQEFGLRNVTEIDWWQAVPPFAGVGADHSVVFTPAQHWSARSGRNRNRTLWGGFMIVADGRRVFFAGDTGYSSHFTELRTRLGSPDLALLPIGAYEPRWFMGPQHMDPEEAVRAHLDLSARISVGTHFGCFQLTDEGIDDPVIELATARGRHAVPTESFQVLETGETRVFFTPQSP